MLDIVINYKSYKLIFYTKQTLTMHVFSLRLSDFTVFCLFSSSVSLSYFKLAVNMLKCSGEHTCKFLIFSSRTEYNLFFQ